MEEAEARLVSEALLPLVPVITLVEAWRLTLILVMLLVSLLAAVARDKLLRLLL